MISAYDIICANVRRHFPHTGKHVAVRSRVQYFSSVTYIRGCEIRQYRRLMKIDDCQFRRIASQSTGIEDIFYFYSLCKLLSARTVAFVHFPSRKSESLWYDSLTDLNVDAGQQYTMCVGVISPVSIKLCLYVVMLNKSVNNFSKELHLLNLIILCKIILYNFTLIYMNLY